MIFNIIAVPCSMQSMERRPSNMQQETMQSPAIMQSPDQPAQLKVQQNALESAANSPMQPGKKFFKKSVEDGMDRYMINLCMKKVQSCV